MEICGLLQGLKDFYLTFIASILLPLTCTITLDCASDAHIFKPFKTLYCIFNTIELAFKTYQQKY